MALRAVFAPFFAYLAFLCLGVQGEYCYSYYDRGYTLYCNYGCCGNFYDQHCCAYTRHRMNVFSVRGLSPHKRTPLVSIPGCEPAQCKASQQKSGNLYRRQYLNRSLSFSTSCPWGSHYCYSQPADHCRGHAAGQRLGLRTRLPRSQLSLNAVAQHVCLTTWVKVRLDSILHQLGNISPKARVPNAPGFRIKQLLGGNNIKGYRSRVPQNGQVPPLPVSEPAPEKLCTDKDDTKQDSELQTTYQQHSFAKAMIDTNECIYSYHQERTFPKHPADDNVIHSKGSLEEKSAQLAASTANKSQGIFKTLRLPIPDSFLSQKDQTLTKLSAVEETVIEKQSMDTKEKDENVTTKKESSTEDDIKIEQSEAEEAHRIAIQNTLPYEHPLKSPDHRKLRETIELKGSPQIVPRRSFINFLKSFTLWMNYILPKKKIPSQTPPAGKITAAEQESSFEDKHERVSPQTSTEQSMSLYHPLSPPKRPAIKHGIQSNTPEDEEEVGWNVFRKFSIPFRDSPSPPTEMIARRKTFISRSAIEVKTRQIVSGLKSAENHSSKMEGVRELCEHIKKFPSCRHDATELKAVPTLLQLNQSGDQEMMEETLEALALLGYTAPVKGQGIRILCLDGGGTRGLVSIMCLKQLEKLSNRKVYELFDYVCGVSTGALLAAIAFLYRIPLDDCETMYEDFSNKMFSRSRVIGTGGLVWNYAFYDSDQWEQILQSELGHKPLIEFARDPLVPKVAAVSTVLNTPRMQTFVFRNYNFPPSVYSQYIGSCTYELWEVIRASSAAPGYYEDFCLDNYVHLDGGLLVNNPTALAIHESRLLWPYESIQCVMSLGTGRYEPIMELSGSSKVSLKEKLSKMVDNATDTEEVHSMMVNVMPPDTYFRFNPYLSEQLPLDEIRKDKLGSMKRDTTMYLRKNELKMRKAVEILKQRRLPHKQAMDWVKLKVDTRF